MPEFKRTIADPDVPDAFLPDLADIARQDDRVTEVTYDAEHQIVEMTIRAGNEAEADAIRTEIKIALEMAVIPRPFSVIVNVPADAQDRWEQVAKGFEWPPHQIIRYAAHNRIRATVMATSQEEAEVLVQQMQEAFIEAVKPKEEEA